MLLRDGDIKLRDPWQVRKQQTLEAIGRLIDCCITDKVILDRLKQIRQEKETANRGPDGSISVASSGAG